MKRMILSMTLLSALAAASCQKNAAQQPQSTTDLPKAGTTAAAAVQSFKNPFDYMGEEHNEALQYGWDNLQKTGDTTKAGKRACLVQYFKERYGRDLNKTIDANAWMEKMSPEEILSKSPFTNGCTELLRAILNAGKTLKEEGNLEEYRTAIERIESEAVQAGLADKERNGVLQVAAIAKYSADYWHRKLTDFPPPTGASLRWLINLTADNVGAIIGLFGGDMQGEADYMSDLVNFYLH